MDPERMTPEQRCRLINGTFDQQSTMCILSNPPDPVDPGESWERRNARRQYCMMSEDATSCMYDVKRQNEVQRFVDTQTECWKSMPKWNHCWQ